MLYEGLLLDYHRSTMATMGRKERTDIIRNFASGLRFPQLFFLLLALFLVDLVFPDPIPFIDEAILGLLAVVFATWKERKHPEMEKDRDEERVVKNVTPSE